MNDASSSHVLALTFGVFPGTICISSCFRFVASASALRVLLQLALSLLPLTPRDVLRIARLPGVSGPSGDRSDAATSANSTCVSLTSRQVFRSWLSCVLEFFQLLDASFRIGLSDLVSCRCRPWASLALRRFLPVRSPGMLSHRGVLRVVVAFALPCGASLAIGFEDVSIGRMR